VTIHHLAPSPATRAGAAGLSIVQSVLSFNDDLVAYGRSLLAEPGLPVALIHCHEWFMFPAARQLARIAGVPVVSTLHMLEEPIRRWWGETPTEECIQLEQALCDESDLLIAVSRSLRAIIQTTHDVPDSRIQVVYNGLDVAAFLPATWNAETLGGMRQMIAPAHAKIVLFAGRLHPQKGIAALFAAAAQVLVEQPDVRYLLAGEAHTRDAAHMIQELMQQHPILRKKAKLLGKLPRKQLALLYQIADVAVMPSIYEPFGFVAIEAMSAGRPVIATAVGGFAEIIQHDQTGLLVPVHAPVCGPHTVDLEHLISAQLRLLNDDALADRLGQAGQRRVLNQFSLETMAQATLQVYRQAIGA
jgi:alpha-maltose-1-phosphate synthase